MTNDEIDRIVYACRQSGDDSTYAIIRAAIAAAVGVVGPLNNGPEPDDLSVAYFMGLHAGKRAPQPAAQDAAVLRDAAIEMLADWVHAVNTNGTGWDDWDEHFKDAAFRPGPLRELLDEAIAAKQGGQ